MMQNVRGEHTGQFVVLCCGKRRGFIPSVDGEVRGILICFTCDQPMFPNADEVHEVPPTLKTFAP